MFDGYGSGYAIDCGYSYSTSTQHTKHEMDSTQHTANTQEQYIGSIHISKDIISKCLILNDKIDKALKIYDDDGEKLFNKGIYAK